MTQAQLLRTDGTRENITPHNGETFEFVGEAYDLIGAKMIQICETHDGRLLLVDEEGKLTDKRVNVAATALYAYGATDPIVGDAIVCDTHQLT
jgi:hypothetical protein